MKSLFDKENGSGQSTSVQPTSKSSTPRSGSSSLESMMQQEKQQEAEVRRQQEEQVRIVAEQKRREQQLAEQRRKVQGAAQAQERQRQAETAGLMNDCELKKSSCSGGCMGGGFGLAMTGSPMAQLSYLNCNNTCEQQSSECRSMASSGESQGHQAAPSDAMVGQFQQIVNEKQQREQADRQRYNQAIDEQNAALKRRIANNNQNQQDIENNNRLQQAATAQRQQQQVQEQQRKAQEKQRQAQQKTYQNLTNCVEWEDRNGIMGFRNGCSAKASVSYCVTSGKDFDSYGCKPQSSSVVGTHYERGSWDVGTGQFSASSVGHENVISYFACEAPGTAYITSVNPMRGVCW